MAAAYTLVEIAHWHRAFNRILRREPHKRIKPLDCFGCLSFWISIPATFAPTTWIDKGTIIAATAVIAHFIGKQITESKLK